MKKDLTKSILWTMLFLFISQLYAQDTNLPSVEFRNAPVLFKENNKYWQQVIAGYRSENPGKIVFLTGREELIKADIHPGNNRYLITFPAVSKPRKVKISVIIDKGPVVEHSITLIPTKKWQIYLVQHSHTDIGYTRPQSEILAEHMRYIDYVLDYCDQTDDLPDDARFRWTCESAWVTREYLRTRPDGQIERLKKRIAEGRVEVTGMYANMSEIADENIMYDFVKPLKEFDDLGIPVKTAMQNDVNGIAWCMPDYFKGTGIKYLIMGINETRSVLPFNKPTCFWWEALSGERLLAFRADHYHTGNFFGLDGKSIKPEIMLWHLADLDNKGYPFDRISIQYSGYYTDNSPPSITACQLVNEWNSKYVSPKLRLSTCSEFLEYIEEKYSDQLPVYPGAWLDWWTDGFGSASRETAEIRKIQNLKQVTEGILTMVSILDGKTNPELEKKIDHISESILFFNEHTCGADQSISQPFSENTIKQWLQKGAYAWEAVKKTTLLHEEALAHLQTFMKKADFPVIYVVNSMGWDRPATVRLFIDYEVLPQGKDFSIIDLYDGKEVPFQFSQGRKEGAYWNIEVSDVPAFGFKALKIDITEENKMYADIHRNENTEVLENRFFRIVIDKNTGGIKEFFDKELLENIYDAENPYFIGQPVRETLEARNKMNPSYSTVFNVKVEPGELGSIWNSVKISADLEGFNKGESGKPKGMQWEIKLFHNSKKVEINYRANKEIITDPEGLYITFPFQLHDSRIVFETIGGVLTQGEQLPGSSSDWNVAQNFVSVKGANGQIIIVSDEIPLWHFSDFNIGRFEYYPKPGKPWLYSWVMNNYWFTNFRAFQLGTFSWTYTITSTSDTTVTSAAKFARGVRNPLPTRTLPAGKNELTSAQFKILDVSGDENVLLINSRPLFKENCSVLLHFREIDGKPANISLISTIENHPITSIKQVNILGEKIMDMNINNILFNPNEVKFIEVEF